MRSILRSLASTSSLARVLRISRQAIAMLPVRTARGGIPELSGRDFAGQDIRGRDFSSIALVGASFAGARAGLPTHRRYALVTALCTAGVVATMIATLGGILGGNTAEHRLPAVQWFWILYAGVLLLLVATALRSGLRLPFAFCFGGLAIVGTIGWMVKGYETSGAAILAVSLAWSGAGVVFATALRTIPEAAVIAVVGPRTGMILSLATAAAAALAIIALLLASQLTATAAMVCFIVIVIGSALSFVTAIGATKSDEHDNNIRSAAKVLAAIGATSFRHADLSGVDFEGADLAHVDFRQANLHRTIFRGARHLEFIRSSGTYLDDPQVRRVLQTGTACGANLRYKNMQGVSLRRYDLRAAGLYGTTLRGADLSEAVLFRADLRVADLSQTCLDGADLREADLQGAILVGSTLRNADLSGSRVYGVAAWDLDVTGSTQHDLIITPCTDDRDRGITLDNIKVAQFIYLLLHNKEVREVIDTITSKVVLLLGRFSPARKELLDELRQQLRGRNYLPILFDFDQPRSRDLTETVVTLAHMARFIVADITDASSVAHELATIIPATVVPVQPILLAGAVEYALLPDFRRRYQWVLPTFCYQDQDQLMEQLDHHVLLPAESKARELRRNDSGA